MPYFAASSRTIVLASLLLALSACATPKTADATASTQPVATDDGASAAGDTPLSFTLVSVSGEASRDSHSTTTTWIINGGRITRSESSEGSEQLRAPDGWSAEASADVTNEASLRRAVNDAAARVAPDQAAPALVDVTYRSICLELQGHRHCAWQVGNDGPDDAFRALDSLETTLSGEVLAP